MFKRLHRQAAKARLRWMGASLVWLMALVACSGGGNQAPILKQPADQFSVANRAIPTLTLSATDMDSTLVYFTAAYRLEGTNIDVPQMPPGLTLNKVTGRVTGTPTAAGVYTLTVTVTDGEGASDSKRMVWTVVKEQLEARINRRTEGAAVIDEMIFTAADTSRFGTVAYCIKPDSARPKADDACFKTDADGGRTLATTIVAGQPFKRHFLWTKDSSDKIVDTTANAPFAPEVWTAIGSSIRPVVGIQTSLGSLAIELDNLNAPISSNNFLQYVDQRFYDNTSFHRIISTFMVQGGGFTYDGSTKTWQAKAGGNPPIVLERTSVTNLSNTKGTVAMARTSVPDSATSQFFLNVVDNLFLNADQQPDGNGYAVFGKLLWGETTADPGQLLPTLDRLKAVAVEASSPPIGTGEVSQPSGTPPSILYTLRLN